MKIKDVLNTVICGDALSVLKTLPDESIDSCITSPPYWGLRDYDAEGQLGLEKTPEEYVAKMVELFREVKRVLKKQGTCWLNLGDSYFGSNCGYGDYRGNKSSISIPTIYGSTKKPQANLGKPKDLVGIPWRVAFALQADGWYLRQDIIWHKPNPMPESVTDRCTKAHEYIFLLAKSQKYYFDNEVIKEPSITNENRPSGVVRDREYNYDSKQKAMGRHKNTQEKGQQANSFHKAREQGIPDAISETRNKRSVWTVNTKPFKEAHFACVDEKTECLTENGWKKYNELSVGDIIAGYDLEKSIVTWTSILDIAKYEVKNQEMIRVKGRAIDMLLTPNHRCVITRRHNKTLKWGNPDIVKADKLKKSHKIIVAPDWGNDKKYNLHKNIITLIGWYITEGSSGVDTISIYQSKTANPIYCDEIKNLLIAVGANFTEHKYIRKWRNKDYISITWRIKDAVATELMSLCPNKRLPDGFLLWDKKSLKILWDTLMKGDGHFRSGGRQNFVQKDKKIIDQVQALATRLSMPSTIQKRSEGTWALYKTEQRDRLLRSEVNGLIGRQNYTGIVWCPNTKYGTFIARRNGRVFVTGNTFPEKLIEPMVKAGCPQFICNKCGKYRENIIEQGQFIQTGGGRKKDTTLSDEQKQKTGYHSKINKGLTDCGCNAGFSGGIILDPFMGSGTTALVARNLRRNFIGVELNQSYIDISTKRLAQQILI